MSSGFMFKKVCGLIQLGIAAISSCMQLRITGAGPGTMTLRIQGDPMNGKPHISLNGLKPRQQQDNTRRSSRVPVGNHRIEVVIMNKAYPAHDISENGISIICDKHIAFTVGQVIENCDLVLPNETLTHLTARVVHFTGADDGNWRNGLQWVNIEKTSLKKIVSLISSMEK